MTGNMKYKEFTGFGVEVYRHNELNNTAFFDKLGEAIEYARDKQSAGCVCKYVTVNEYGCIIDRL